MNSLSISLPRLPPITTILMYRIVSKPTHAKPIKLPYSVGRGYPNPFPTYPNRFVDAMYFITRSLNAQVLNYPIISA